MKHYKQLFIVSVLLLSRTIFAQDFHLSQYDVFSSYLNPALTGNYLGEGGDYRIQALHRNQWRMLSSKPFSTQAIGYDRHEVIKGKDVGLGAYLMNNRSGVANLNTMIFQLSGSYFITDPLHSPHLLNVGLQTGIYYKSFNPSRLLFESQYDYSTGTLNSDINSGEQFTRTGMVKFDANFGVFYKYRETKNKYFPFVGLSLFHLTMPKENFTATKSRLPMRFVAHAGSDFIVTDMLELTPVILFMTQGKATELNIGVLGEYQLHESRAEKSFVIDKEKLYKGSGQKANYSILFGLNYRCKDALVVQTGVRKNNLILKMSYDVNTSFLRSYSSGRGAFEMSLVIVGFKGMTPFKSISQF